VRVSCSDVVSPSYFVSTAAVQLGYFKDEGVDAEFVPPQHNDSQALANGDIDFFGCSPYVGLEAFPGWKGGKILCALSQKTYWFLAVRASLGLQKGDVNALKGMRISASAGPDLALRRLLDEAGIDAARDHTEVVPPPGPDRTGSRARIGAIALEQNLADGFWGNGMRAQYAVSKGLASILLDIRRGDGPPAALDWTFAALVTSERLLRDHPDAAAGAVRAIVKTQQALRADPNLAVKAAREIFPAEETELIQPLIEKDVPFYDPTVTPEMIAKTAQFAREIGALTGEVAYEDVVATQFKDLWTS
jgi:ABC-type nitrate/sulfonate/bicarbonate transport system substrate-binding protein